MDNGKIITPDEFKEEMKKVTASNIYNITHEDADNLMCKVLKQLGYSEGIEIFENMVKWYD